jgi:dienelactone hydrolase
LTRSDPSRRTFTAALTGLVARAHASSQTPEESQIGTLYGPIQAIADSSPLDLSFLRLEFRDLNAWQKTARAQVFALLQYAPAPVAADVRVIEKVQRDGYTEERLTFKTTPQFRVPAHVLIPNGPPQQRPAVILLHDHGGFYVWGREKVLATDNEHPVLTKFKLDAYGGRSIGTELVRRGYVVIAIDMFYWGERRLQMAADPPEWAARSRAMTEQQINEFNRRASQNEQLIARSLLTAGVTWPGVMLWDDIRTFDYLASRPEVDRNRIACVGLSVGGYRSFMLAALETRIKAAVDVCWMTTFTAQIERHIINTMGLTFVIPGMYRHFDLPDLAAAIAPRSLLLMMGSQDGLFPLAAMKASFEKIGRCFAKAGVPDHQRCRMFDSPHQFNLGMQAEAWRWLEQSL